MSETTSAKIAECLDLALNARLKAKSVQSSADRIFWQAMERRYIRLAQAYRETDQLKRDLHFPDATRPA